MKKHHEILTPCTYAYKISPKRAKLLFLRRGVLISGWKSFFCNSVNTGSTTEDEESTPKTGGGGVGRLKATKIVDKGEIRGEREKHK
jgi:hypothetical protein